jgi:dihydroorotase
MKNNNVKGCNIRIVLPNDSKPIVVSSKMYGTRNDIQKVLPTTGSFLHKMVEEKR